LKSGAASPLARQHCDGVALLHSVSQFMRKQAFSLQRMRIVSALIEENVVPVREGLRLQTAAHLCRAGIGVDAHRGEIDP
jgi:hypothetical protein